MTDIGARWRRLAGLGVGAVFVVVIALPAACKLLHIDPVPEVREYRPMAERPALPRDRAALEAFPGKFEAWYNDHFGLRSALIRGMHLVHGHWLGADTAVHVIRGSDNWFYYTEKPAGTHYDAVRAFRPEELERWGRVLQKRHDWVARHGARYVVMIPPDKQTVYPEHYPSELRPRHVTRLDQLKDYLARHTTVPLIDLRQQLQEAKARERIYHVTDSHWNDRGALIGYQALMGWVAGHFPSAAPLPRSAFSEDVRDELGGDLAQMAALEFAIHEQAPHLEPHSPRQSRTCETGVEMPEDCPRMGPPFAVGCDAPGLPRAVMFHDSFTWALGPFLAEHFRRLVYVWTDQFSPGLVRRERPDVVIQQMVERKLSLVEPLDFDDTQD